MKPRFRLLGNRFIYAVKLKRLVAVAILLLFCITNIAVTVMVQKTFLPVVSAYAISYAKSQAVNTIYKAVEQVILTNDVTYKDLYTIARNPGGDITSLEINTAGVNLFKTNLAKAVKADLTDSQYLKIPLGNVFNNIFMMGRGPRIPVKLSAFGFTTAEITGDFSSAGLNQTRHAVSVIVETNVSVVLPYNIQTVAVKTTVPVTETVIVGKVPSLYSFSSEH